MFNSYVCLPEGSYVYVLLDFDLGNICDMWGFDSNSVVWKTIFDKWLLVPKNVGTKILTEWNPEIRLEDGFRNFPSGWVAFFGTRFHPINWSSVFILILPMIFPIVYPSFPMIFLFMIISGRSPKAAMMTQVMWTWGLTPKASLNKSCAAGDSRQPWWFPARHGGAPIAA